MSNTIDSKLQLTEVLDSAMEAIKRKLMPLLAFSTVFRNVQLKGDDTLAVPFYPLATSASATRAANGSRKALASATATESRVISNFTNKVQALSFTARERSRQPAFNPEMHGRMKGEKLAFDILADIFGVVRRSVYTGTSIPATTGGNFDEDDVADLRKICSEEFWPDSGRSLLLNPTFAANLLKQQNIIDAGVRSQGNAAFADGVLGRVLGFDLYEVPALPTNNGNAFAVTGTASTDVISAVAHGLSDGDAVIFPTLSGGSGLTAASTRYFIRDAAADSFKVSATVGGAAVNFATDISSGTCRKYEDVHAIAVLPSSILVGFVPVPPTGAIRKELFDYQELVDESGLVLQYYHFGLPDTDEEVQTIECHYGFGSGDAAQLKIIGTPLA